MKQSGTKLKNLFLTTILFGVIIAIPIFFNIIFKDSNKSYFWFFESSISVSDWFSFWISYLSLLVSTFLAYAALKLTQTIEYSNVIAEVDKNKVLLKVTQLYTDLELKDKQKKDYRITVVMPRDVLIINKLKIKSAQIEFENGEIFKLCPHEKIVETNCFLLSPKVDDENESCLQENTTKLLKWKYWESQSKNGYETINLRIMYEYVLPSFVRISRDFVCKTELIYKIKSKESKNFDTETIEMATIKKELSLGKKGKV